MTKWDGEQRRLLTPNEFRQMAGRAGRRGLDARGVALVLYSPWVTFERSMEVAQGDLLPLRSAFRPSHSTTINLWRGPADEDRLADLYARSLRRFQHDRRVSHLAEVREGLHARFEELSARDPGDPEAWQAARDLSRAEHALNRAHALAGREARAVVEGLARVLDRFGYLNVRRPSAKAAYLRAIFDSNALTLSELLAGRYLEPLEPAEIAEVASWFSWDRDSPVRGLPIPARLHRLRADVNALHASVLAEEARHGVEVSRPLYEDFRGVALAWAQGRTLEEIAGRSRIAEGDLVGHFQKTIDLLGQLRAAVTRARRPDGPALLERLGDADTLLRRGVVAASYRWAVEGPPAEADAEAADWTPRPVEREPDRRDRRDRRQEYRPGQARGRGRGRSRGEAGAQDPRRATADHGRGSRTQADSPRGANASSRGATGGKTGSTRGRRWGSSTPAQGRPGRGGKGQRRRDR
jgi:superfamily II RNA helicase